MMKHVLDLTNRAWVRHVPMGLTLIGTWMRDADDRWRPALVIVRRGEEGSDHTIPCIVSVDRAWIWEPRVGDAAQAARTCLEFARALRLGEDPRTLVRLHLIINDHLGDLLHIKPRRPQEQEVVGEVTIRDSTGRMVEREMLEDV